MGRGDIESAAGQDREIKARGVEDLYEIGAAGKAFGEFGAAGLHELADIADAVEELAPGEGASEEFGHDGSP